MRFMQALHSPVLRAAAITCRRKGGHSPGPSPSSLAPAPPVRPLRERAAGSYSSTGAFMAVQSAAICPQERASSTPRSRRSSSSTARHRGALPGRLEQPLHR